VLNDVADRYTNGFFNFHPRVDLVHSWSNLSEEIINHSNNPAHREVAENLNTTLGISTMSEAIAELNLVQQEHTQK